MTFYKITIRNMLWLRINPPGDQLLNISVLIPFKSVEAEPSSEQYGGLCYGPATLSSSGPGGIIERQSRTSRPQIVVLHNIQISRYPDICVGVPRDAQPASLASPSL